jgi:hypothetical protein
VVHSSELNIAEDGSLDWDDEYLAGFDLLVAAVHSHFDQPADVITRRLIAATEHPLMNIIGHPTTRSLGRRPPVDFDVDAVFAAAARTGTALEINAFPDRLDLDDTLARQARDHGVAFVIDTDAHSVLHLDHMRFGVAPPSAAGSRPGRSSTPGPWAGYAGSSHQDGSSPGPEPSSCCRAGEPASRSRGRARDAGDAGQVVPIGIFLGGSASGVGMRISRIPSL